MEGLQLTGSKIAANEPKDCSELAQRLQLTGPKTAAKRLKDCYELAQRLQLMGSKTAGKWSQKWHPPLRTWGRDELTDWLLLELNMKYLITSDTLRCR